MPIIRQHRYFREDLRANPHVLYVFGDNAERRGLGGQAKAARGEPNALGIVTKLAPNNRDQSFLSDQHFEEHRAMIEEGFAELEAALEDGRLVVYPLDGIGTGLSDMPARSPRLFAYIEGREADLFARFGLASS